MNHVRTISNEVMFLLDQNTYINHADLVNFGSLKIDELGKELKSLDIASTILHCIRFKS